MLTVCGLSLLPRPAAGEDGVPYRPKIEGVDDSALRELLEASSQLFTEREQIPLSIAALRRRAQGDVERLETALKSEGYYQGRVTPVIDTGGRRVTATLQVDPGPAFPLRSYDIRFSDDPLPQGAETLPRTGPELGFSPGDRATGAKILGAQGRFIAAARQRGFAFGRLADRKVVVDLRDKVVDVTAIVTLGQRVRFGALDISGLERVDETFVAEYAPWQENDIFDPSLVKLYADRLQGTALFTSVEVRAAERAEPDGRLPVVVRLKERKRRTIGGGFEFATNNGPGASLFWENRNIGGRGQKLRADLEVAQIRQGLRFTYEQPRFRRFDQSLKLSVGAAIDDTDAFRALTATTTAGVERRKTRKLTLGGRVELEYARTQDTGITTDSYLVALPLSVRWDATNDLLNPTKGQRASITVTPAAGVNDEFVQFLTNDVRGSAYKAIGDEGRWVAAARFRYASIIGTDTSNIPAGRRLYAGGGGSVRPIQFQFAGPLDIDGGPAGGRSAIETGAELRVAVTEAFGLVPFVEGGTVYDGSRPDFASRYFTGGGLGAYYLTPAGPFRFDVAVPFNGRNGVDDAFQIYVSLGQAF